MSDNAVSIRPYNEATGDQKLNIVAIAMEDLAIVQALMIIHGTDRGYQKYVDAGGRVRNHNGQTVVWLDGDWWYLADQDDEDEE